MFFLGLTFLITAFLYACIGFGGGSTYNALLVLGNTDYQIIPVIALACNIIVVSGGAWHFSRAKRVQMGRIFPWIAFSIPSSFVGGLVAIPEIYFISILGIALLLSGLKLLWPEGECQTAIASNQVRFAPPILGTFLGLLAGITGIGGGILLAPVLHFLNWGSSKQIAAACTIFILFNSLSGIAGQLMKLHDYGLLSLIVPHWVLFPAVIIGGQIGSWLGSSKVNEIVVKKMTAILILYVAVRLLLRSVSMI